MTHGCVGERRGDPWEGTISISSLDRGEEREAKGCIVRLAAVMTGYPSVMSTLVKYP